MSNLIEVDTLNVCSLLGQLCLNKAVKTRTEQNTITLYNTITFPASTAKSVLYCLALLPINRCLSGKNKKKAIKK